MTNNQRNTSGANNLNNKIDALNNSINDLVDVLEKLSSKTQSGGGGGRNNPFIRPGSRRTSNQRDRERNFYYEWSQYYKAPKRDKKWSDMSDEEKESYNKKKNNSKQEAQDYVRRSQQREDLYYDLRSSRMGSTALGRYATDLMERNQRIEDYGMMGKYMQTNADKIGKGLFGNGKAGAAATKAIGGFGKALGGVSKLLGGPWTAVILTTIDLFKKLGEGMNDWKKGTADMYEHQTKQEQLQYERQKQDMLIENQMRIENVSAQGDIQMKMLEAQGATMLDALKLTSQQYAKSVETAIGPLTKGINQSAYDAMKYSTAAAADYKKLLLHQGQRETEFRRYSELRELQKAGKLAGLEAEKGVNETQYTINSQQAALDFQQKFAREHWFPNIIRNPQNNQLQGRTEDNTIGNTSVVNGKKYNTITNTEQAGIGHIDNPNAWGDAWEKLWRYQEGNQAKKQGKFHNEAEIMRQMADYNKVSVDMQYQLATTEKDYTIQTANKQLELATSAAEIEIDTATDIRNMFIDLAQKSEQWIENFDKTTNDLAINLGYTNTQQIRGFQDTMFQNAKIAAKFGKTTEDLAKLQQDYAQSTGRNRMFDKHDYGQMMGLGKYLGDEGLAASYASEMEIFNVGVADSVDMLDEALQDVNRMGLNGRKYTKTLVDNLKLAQKYNFKGGTKGLMEMAKWAENTRFNLSSLGGMLDKVQEGGLEGIITQSAQFQVLGGHAAMNSDPLAMIFEAYADPDAYAKRMQDMTKGYGQIDKETGETEFSVNEMMMLRQLAKVQGRSFEEVQNEVRARNKKEVVAKQLNGNFNEEQQALISNNATYDKATGQFKVKVKQGNQYVDKDVNQLTPEDIDKLIPEKHNERMEDYMATVVNLLEKSFGEEEREKIEVGEGVFDNTIKNQEERIANAISNFEKKKDEYIAKIKEIQDKTTENYTDFLEMASNGNTAIDKQSQEISATASNINNALQSTAEIILEANKKIASAIGIEYNAPTLDGNLLKFKNNKAVSQAASQFMNNEMMWNLTNNGAVGKSNFKNLGLAIQSGKKEDIISSMDKSGMFTHSISYHLNNNGIDWKNLKDEEKVEIAKNFYDSLTDNETMKREGNKEYWDNKKNDWVKIKDGIISNNSPIISQADKVTKVHDATSYVQSDPKDVALFAKNGGPFDKLFNDIFGRINDIHNNMSNFLNVSKLQNKTDSIRISNNKLLDNLSDNTLSSSDVSIKSLAAPQQMIIQSLSKQMGVSPNDIKSGILPRMGKQTEIMEYKKETNTNGGVNNVPSNTNYSQQPIDVKLSGEITLKTENGQTFDITKQLENDPMLIRAISRMISKQITVASNGGRGKSIFNIGSV